VEPAGIAPTQSLLAVAEPLHDIHLTTGPDLQAAADVCTSIGQLTRADDLPRLLQQAATVLDASGMVIWMAAGEELFAAAAYGYPPQVIQKLGPINRSAINATAAAWRNGALQAVSGGHDTRGALAAPMLGPDRCVGVLAAEVGFGQESDATRRAIAMMFAAQLAAALAGWPAASAAAPATVPPLERAVEG
jgi:GAF domain-containing protein